MKKQNKGITLIALVITIIVLLILAGVTIATLTGDNGILTQAQNAKENTKEAEAEEEIALIANEWAIEKYTSTKSLGEFLDEKVEKGKIDSVQKNADGTYTIGKEDSQITISPNGEKVPTVDLEEWDKTAADEDCFIWGSDTKGEDGYDVIIGYTEKLQSYSKVRIPSRCKKIICDGTYYSDNQYSDDQIGRAFFSNIEKIELPNTVVEIGDYAFGDIGLRFNNLLKEIIVPNSISRIGKWAFAWCGNLKEITIPSSVNDMGREVFMGFSSSQTINIKENTDKPDGWSEDWNDGCNANLIWGYTGD